MDDLLRDDGERIDQIPLNRRKFRFGVYDAREYTVDGRMIEHVLEITAEGAADNRRFAEQLRKFDIV